VTPFTAMPLGAEVVPFFAPQPLCRKQGENMSYLFFLLGICATILALRHIKKESNWF
jgi:hypothetical protein